MLRELDSQTDRTTIQINVQLVEEAILSMGRTWA